MQVVFKATRVGEITDNDAVEKRTELWNTSNFRGGRLRKERVSRMRIDHCVRLMESQGDED